MRQPHLLPRAFLVFLLATIFSATATAQIKATDRISQTANDQQVMRLRGNVQPMVKRAVDQGPVASSMQVNRAVIQFQRTEAQQQALDALLVQLQDPSSPNYHKWLTPEQFGERFGMSTADLAKISGWLQTHGLKVVDVARGRDWIAFSGTAGQIASAFQTQLHHYALNGKTHYANATEPSIPAAFAGVVSGIQSLNDFRPKPRVRKVKANFTSSLSGNHFLAPEDFATIYNVKGLYNAGIVGTGQKIAVAGQSDIILSDIRAFRAASGLSAIDPAIVLVPGSADPGQVSGDIVEASLDVEWSGAVAKDGQITYVNSTNAFNSMQYAVDQNIAPVISISYGDCEPNFSSSDISSLVAIAQKANAQGQTIVGPSGDDAATDCDYSTNPNVSITIATHGLQVDVPAALPYVTGVGGTAFNEGSGTYWNTTNTTGGGSAISYIPEIAWNDTLAEIANGGSITGTGGGASTLFTKPSWQTGIGVPNDNARDVPDISFNASVTHDGYLICSQGSCTNGFRDSNNNLNVVGGTSAGVPTFAGIVALINQQTASSQGNLNPKLYSLAASNPSAFHDITSGDNKAPCQAGTPDCPSGGTIGFTAGTGYDQVTGLGSVDASALAAAWGAIGPPTADFQISSDNTSLTILHGNSKTANITIAPTNGFTGSVAVSCSVSSSLGSTTCSVSPSTITNSGTSVVTINATSSLAFAGYARPLSPHGWLYESGFALSFGMVFTLRKRRRLLMMLAMIVLGVGVLGWSGCGGGSSSSGTVLPTLTGTVTVHAESGTLSHDTHITVTVN
jgi:subtilase family serine protease